MSNELSTVQKLWRDRRPEFEAYLRGDADVLCAGHPLGYPVGQPWFDSPAESYEFRPKPKPPELRPLTRDEWIERRDWWVRDKEYDRIQRLVIINADSIERG